MKILYSFPTRSRPNKCYSALNSIEFNSKGEYAVLLKIDSDDRTMDSFVATMHNDTTSIPKITLALGTSENKIHAMNRDIDMIKEWDILIGMSDDMIFEVGGFDEIIKKDMVDNFPSLDGVLHYNDGVQKSNVMTMSIIGRKYFERFQYIYPPEYTSLWCDVEATEVAYMLDKYRYMGNDKILFRHLHPVWKLAEWDDQYRKTENPELYKKDKRVFLSRRENKYGLNPQEIIREFKYAKI